MPSTNVEPTHLSQPRSCPAGTSACFALPGMRHPAGSRAVFHSAAVLPKAPFTSAVTQNYRQKRALQAPLHHCCAWKRKRMRTGAAAQSGAAVVEQQPDKGPLLSPLRQWRDWWNLKASDQVASESQPQPLRSIVLKLWRLMRVNRGLLAAAFGCMVSWHCCGPDLPECMSIFYVWSCSHRASPLRICWFVCVTLVQTPQLSSPACHPCSTVSPQIGTIRMCCLVIGYC